MFGCSSHGCEDPHDTIAPSSSKAVEPRKTDAPDPGAPGVAQKDEGLMEQLRTALAEKGPNYRPRTHHFNPDGSPKYVNRLILETSPYLLQHAHNPVDWYAWGEPAFARARAEDKPILLSVGYSTCHWCHVMERESFEDEEIARYINEHFIAIKVDREERPDVDDVYMKAVQVMTGGGGWPMTVLLTPDRQPFFAGTYYPARDGDRGARYGFLTILRAMQAEYAGGRDKLLTRAAHVSQRIATLAASGRPSDVPGAEVIAEAVHLLAGRYDATHGGFGHAPKFPRPCVFELLLRHHRRTGDPAALEMVTHTLTRMAAGGMHDQIGGGFHRYSTDAHWLVPHFEKMLYDNAQLVPVYLYAYQLTRRDDFAQVARTTLAYVQREMTAAHGGFYSATDADSPTPAGHEEEGYFFTWSPDELNALLDADAARAVATYFDVTEAGNFEGRSILHQPADADAVARELGLSPVQLTETLSSALPKLYGARAKRPAPARDDKILTSWNGLMISAFAQAALILDDAGFRDSARRAASFLLEHMRAPTGRLLRSYTDGMARHSGFLDDYAFLIQGLLDLFEATGEPRWIEEAIGLQALLDRHHWDSSSGGYYTTADDHEALLARAKPDYDGAEPSGNSVAAHNLLRLADFTSDHAYRERAERTISAFASELVRSPTAAPKLLSALDHYLDSPLEVLIVSPPGADASALVERVRRAFLPNRALVISEDGPPLERCAKSAGVFADKHAVQSKPTAYVCERGRCQLPTSDPDELSAQLAKATTTPG